MANKKLIEALGLDLKKQKTPIWKPPARFEHAVAHSKESLVIRVTAVKAATEKAVLVRCQGADHWMPFSECWFLGMDDLPPVGQPLGPNGALIVIPEWLAERDYLMWDPELNPERAQFDAELDHHYFDGHPGTWYDPF